MPLDEITARRLVRVLLLYSASLGFTKRQKNARLSGLTPKNTKRYSRSGWARKCRKGWEKNRREEKQNNGSLGFCGVHRRNATIDNAG